MSIDVFSKTNPGMRQCLFSWHWIRDQIFSYWWNSPVAVGFKQLFFVALISTFKLTVVRCWMGHFGHDLPKCSHLLTNLRTGSANKGSYLRKMLVELRMGFESCLFLFWMSDSRRHMNMYRYIYTYIIYVYIYISLTVCISMYTSMYVFFGKKRSW